MYLVVCPTELEIALLEQDRELSAKADVKLFVTGPGMVDSAIFLTRILCGEMTSVGSRNVHGVFLFGLAGAYLDSGVNILDFCLAEKELFGDFGVTAGNRIAYFEDPAMGRRGYDLSSGLALATKEVLEARGISYRAGNFVTVNSCSGTAERGEFLRRQFGAICENMEGAAVAQVCDAWDLPLVEVRCISNLVEELDRSKWSTEEAVSKGSSILKIILGELTNRGST